LLLNEKNVANSGFGYFAKVANRGETNEEVNLIFAEARPSGSTTGQLSSLTRVRALPNSGVFEIAMAASTPTRSNPFNNTPAKVGLGCGFHAVTNGTVVFVKGIDHSTGPDTCSGAYSTTLCLNASNLSSASAGSCDSIRDNMTIGTTANLTNWDYSDTSTSVGTSLFNAMQINGSVIQGKTSSVD
jgi:hypothetical protein